MKFILMMYLTFPQLGQQTIKEAEFDTIEQCQIHLRKAMVFYGQHYAPKHVSGACLRV
jgi:hypothetical protein